MDEKKHNAWWARPAGWVCAFLGTLGIQAAAYLICEAGIWLMNWLSGMSTVAIVVLVLLGGGIYTSLFLYSMVMLPSVTVHLSNIISKSRRGVRYWVFGIYTIAGCALLIYAGIVGAVSGCPMVWYYIRFAYIIISSAIMILLGVAEAEPKDTTGQKGGKTVPAWTLWACIGVFLVAAVLVAEVYIPGVWQQAESTAAEQITSERIESYNRGYDAGEEYQKNHDLRELTIDGVDIRSIVSQVEREYGIDPAEAYSILEAYSYEPNRGGFTWDDYQGAIEVVVYTASLFPRR